MVVYNEEFFKESNWVTYVDADKLLEFAESCKERITAPSAREKFIGHMESMKNDVSYPGLRHFISELRQVKLRENLQNFLKPSKKRQAADEVPHTEIENKRLKNAEQVQADMTYIMKSLDSVHQKLDALGLNIIHEKLDALTTTTKIILENQESASFL